MARRFDTSGEIPARAAVGFAATALAIAFLAPLLPRDAPQAAEDVRVPEESASEVEDEEDRVTIVAREGWDASLGAIGMTLVALAPLRVRNLGLFKLGQRIAAVLLVLGVLLTIRSVGVLFAPSALLLVLAATRKPPPDPFR